MLPWMTAELDDIEQVFGGDPWPYGVEANRPTLERAGALSRRAGHHRQGAARRRPVRAGRDQGHQEPVHELARLVRPADRAADPAGALAGRQHGARQLLAERAVADGVALRRLAARRRADLPRQLHDPGGGDRLRDRRHAGGAAAVRCCAGSRSSWRSSIRSWSAATARPSSPSRRCSSCGSASASNPRSRWSRRWCSSSSISRRCRECARSTPSSCRWRRWSAPTSARSAATSCFPGAVPNIFAGFRIAVPYAIGAAVIAELISSNRGLGYLVQTGAMNFDTTQVFVAILAATIIVHVFIAVVDLGERFLLRWRPRGAALDRRSRDLSRWLARRCWRSKRSASASRRGPDASRRRGSSRT